MNNVTGTAHATKPPAKRGGQPRHNPSRQVLVAMIEKAADDHGIPRPILKAVAEHESSWRQFKSDGSTLTLHNPTSTDWGIMQINDAAHPGYFPRAKTDIAYNLACGASYLASLYDRYGNWPDALAAYNAGSVRHSKKSHKYVNQSYVNTVFKAARRFGYTSPLGQDKASFKTSQG